MSAVLYPYPTLPLPEPPDISVTEVRLDTGTCFAPKLPDPEVYLHEVKDIWRTATLDLSLTCEGDLKGFEEAHGPVSAVVVANCLPTNTRQRLAMTRSDTVTNRWEGQLVLDRANFAKRVDLTAVFTATVGGVPHRTVAVTSRREVYFDRPESVRLNGTLDVRWRCFKADQAVEPGKSFPESSHFVAFDKALPAIWLNRDFDGLEALLADRKDRDAGEKGVHDMLRLGIARGAWMTLLGAALAGVQPGEDGEEPDWPTIDWQKQVLRLVLPKIDPTKPERELLVIAADARTTPGGGEFFARVEAVVDEHLLDANRVLRGYVQRHGRETK